MAAASAPLETRHHKVTGARCGANTKRGGVCGLAAGTGTSHPGYGLCKFHGGSTPTHVRHAARLMAIELADELEMEPHEALLWTLRKAAGRVAYWTSILAGLEPDSLVVEQVKERTWSGENGSGQETTRTTHPELRIEYHALLDAEEELAKRAKMALDAGVAERQVKVVEQWAGQLSAVLEAVLSRLELTAEQQARAPEIVRGQLLALEGGKP